MNVNWRKVFSPAFIVAMTGLVVALVALQSAVRAFEVYLIKLPIPLREELFTMRDRFGDYELRADHEPLSAEMEAELGTRKYITRTFRDKNKSENDPGGLIQLHVAYYTGTPDAVPHVPERCQVAGGAKPVGIEHRDVMLNSPYIFPNADDGRDMTMTLGGVKSTLPSRTVPLRVFTYREKVEEFERPAAIGYFFISNGSFIASPEEVRLKAFDLREKYAYWCKVEVRPLNVQRSEDMVEVAGKFLSAAMPEILSCLPDWHEVREGRYPPPAGGTKGAAKP